MNNSVMLIDAFFHLFFSDIMIFVFLLLIQAQFINILESGKRSFYKSCSRCFDHFQTILPRQSLLVYNKQMRPTPTILSVLAHIVFMQNYLGILHFG